MSRPLGLSLLEVIVALAVLTGSAVILSQMIDVGTRHAERAARITEAQTAAHNLLNEMIAGMRPWEASETPQPVDLWSPWDYQVTIEPVGLGDLSRVTVTVSERPTPTLATAEEAPLALLDPSSRARSYRLTRWVRSASTSSLDETWEFGQGSPPPLDF